MKKFCLLVLLLSVLAVNAQNIYRNDFEFLWTRISEEYAYPDKKLTNWNKVKEYYTPAFDTITSNGSFILQLEKVLNEIYDHHVSLNSNTKTSQRLVPSGTDIWAEYIANRPFIIEVRRGFGAAICGLKPGMEIISFNDIPVQQAIQLFYPISFNSEDKEAKNFALRTLVAGLFIDDRKIVVRDKGIIKAFYPDRPEALLVKHQYKGPLESRLLPGNIGYIRINDRLWDNDLIPVFDSVLGSFQNTRALILDLRETPGGGNTTVARAIMGSFISKEGYYQKHEYTAEEKKFRINRSWMEIVSPRKKIYTKPLVILVNHWTGSVAEGITIGFDALKRATSIGTPMAGLKGANYSYQMPGTKIGFSFPAEKLFHVNGKPREDFLPTILVDIKNQVDTGDIILRKAIDFLKK